MLFASDGPSVAALVPVIGGYHGDHWPRPPDSPKVPAPSIDSLHLAIFDGGLSSVAGGRWSSSAADRRMMVYAGPE